VDQHLDGFAAEDNRLQPAAPVRGHGDQVAAPLAGCIDDPLVDVFVFGANDVAGNACLFGNGSGSRERRFRIGRQIFVHELAGLIRHGADGDRLSEHAVQRPRDMHHGQLRTERGREGRALGERAPRAFRAVGRDEDVLVHGFGGPSG